MKNIARIFFAVVVFVAAAAAIAQSTQEVRLEGDVVAVYGNKLVVKMSTGEVREFTPPPDRRFEVDGRMLSLAELKPGTHLSATITTTTTPEVVRTVVLKNAEVVSVSGSNLVVKQEGQFKSYMIPAGFTFLVDGEKVPVSKLRAGSKLTAEIVYRSEKTLTEQEVRVAGATPVVAPVAAAEPAPEPIAEVAPASEPEMPSTASNLPLLALLGLAFIAAAMIIRR